MRIAVPTRDRVHVAGHAGKARQWLIFDLADLRAGTALPAPVVVELAADEVLHHVTDDRPHPLDGVDLVIAASAGDGFIRHMKTRGAEVILTGESDPATAIAKLAAGEALAEQPFDITTALCKLRDLFSRH